MILLYNKLGEALGENVGTWSGTAIRRSDFDGSLAIETWYSEVNRYDFNLNEIQSSAGQFSQLVIFENFYILISLG